MNHLSRIARGLGGVLLYVVIVLVPIIGQIIATCLIVMGKRPIWKAIFWGIVVWAVPYAGPFTYLTFGTDWPYKRVLLVPVIIASVVVVVLLLLIAGYQAG